jgi:hypothetical protein
MRRFVHVGMAALLLGGLLVSLSAQTRRLVTIQLDLANGGRPSLTVAEGDAATLRLAAGGAFQFRPRVSDAAAGDVTVAIVGGEGADGPLLAELALRVGAPAVQSGTSPSFGIAVARIVQQ